MICHPIPHPISYKPRQLVLFVGCLAALARVELSAAEEVSIAERKALGAASEATCAWLEEASDAVRTTQRAVTELGPPP